MKKRELNCQLGDDVILEMVPENFQNLSSGFGKVASYKINTQKSIAFLYTNSEKLEKEIQETIQFIIISKRVKYLGISLPEETKDLYWEN